MNGIAASLPSEVPRRSHTTERGELVLSRPAPSVFVFEYKGYADDGFITFIENVWNAWFAGSSTRVHIFVDTQEQTGYSAGFRNGMMTWSKGMVARSDTYLLLVKSRWVALGIAIVRASVGLPAAHAEVTTNREIFRSKLEAAVRRSQADARG